MAIKIECGDCGKAYTVKDEMEGKKIRCKECSAVIVVRSESGEDWNDEVEEEFLPPVRKSSKSKRKRGSEFGGRPLTAWIAISCLGAMMAITLFGALRVVLMEMPFVPPERIVAVKAVGLLFIGIGLVIQLVIFLGLLKGSSGMRMTGMILGGIMTCFLLLSLLRTLTVPNAGLLEMLGVCMAIGLRVTFIGCLLTPSASRHFNQ